MKTKWFNEKMPDDGQLIGFTWQGDSDNIKSDDPRPGPYLARGRYCAEFDCVVLRDLQVMRVTAGFAWHPLEGKRFTPASIE